MKCPECQFENPGDFHFCGKCGYQISIPSNPGKIEESLKTKLERIQRYLPSALVEKILSQRDEIEGEQRQVTIMFCDIKESTPLVEKLGPEKAFSFLNQILEILIQTVHEYEGTVNELRGDGILALFGAPYAIENAPFRAIESALAIHWGIAHFNETSGFQSGLPLISLRIGINTGPVVVGSVGNDLRVKFTAVGDTINLAARMEQMAEPGTTYVTEDTFRQTNELFEFKSLGKKKIKGKEKPLNVYRVLFQKKEVHQLRLIPARKYYSKMVGRDDELNRLTSQVIQVINGRGSVVNVIGEAGIGKSRLIAELKALNIIDQVSLIEGRAISIGKNLSYHPIIDFLKQWAQISIDDAESTAFEKLEMAVRNVCPDSLSEVLPFVATLMRMTLPERYAQRIKGVEGEALERLILKNVRQLLTNASKMIPIVIVAEDLHWADTSSFALLGSLYRLAETERILFVNLFRPGYELTSDKLINLIEEKLPDHYVEINLKPLDEQTAKSILSAILNLSYKHKDIIDRIIRRTGGNPFFIEEVVSSLIDQGAVVQKNNLFQLTEKINTVDIPHSIIDVLMTRIDQLEAETRDLLKAASVIGQEFHYRILSEVARKVIDIDARLAYLKVIQLIRERKKMGEVEYLFNHSLVQEVAYGSILPTRKINFHLKVASSIEKVFAQQLNKYYGMLAYHYTKAQSPKKTEEYLIKAGEEALKSSASSEALNYYQDALDLYLNHFSGALDPEKVAVLEKNIALALYNKGQHVRSVEYFDKALNHYWGPLPKHLFPTMLHLSSGFFHFLVSLYIPFLKFKKTPTLKDIETIDLYFKKLKNLAIINPKRYFIESIFFYKKLTRFDLTKIDLGIGMFAGASNLFSFTGISFGLSRRIINILRNKIDEKDVKSYIIFDFSDTLHKYMAGDWTKATAHDDGLVEKNLSIGEIYWTSQHYFWHGCLALHQGRLGISEQSVNKLNDLFDVYENKLSMLLKYLLNTSLLMESHQFHDALAEIDAGIEFGTRITLGTPLTELYSRQAHIQILINNLEGAKKSLTLADNVRSEIDTVPWQLVDFYRSCFEYDLFQLNEALKKGDKNELTLYRKKANKSGKKFVKTTQKVAQYRTDSYRLRGVYYWLIDDQKNAIHWWQKAIKEGKSLDARIELARTYFEVGKRLLEEKSKYEGLNGIRANEYLEKAQILFEEMNLQWDLDQLNRISGR